MFGTKKILAGAASGIAGGLVFGMMMAKMGMLPVIGKMVGSPTAAAGWLVHLMISAVIGASFAVVFGWLVSGRTSSVVFGTMYGTAWWLIGPLTVMPLMMGMGLGVNWNLAAAQSLLPSLMGHMLFGVVMGWTFDPVLRRLARSRSTAARVEKEAEAAA